jgi:hypothetical protein
MKFNKEVNASLFKTIFLNCFINNWVVCWFYKYAYANYCPILITAHTHANYRDH